MQAKYEFVANNSRDALTNATTGNKNHINTLYIHHINILIVIDHRLPDTDEKLEIQNNEVNAINALTLTIASHYDRLSFAIKYVYNYHKFEFLTYRKKAGFIFVFFGNFDSALFQRIC
jgi:hypothetical protein